MGYHYTVVSRLVRKHTQTNNVKDLSKSGRPRVTFDRDDSALQRLVRRMPFAASPVLKQHWLPNRCMDSWLDVPWGIGCMFVSPNLHPAVD
jgi:hypothetical protein